MYEFCFTDCVEVKELLGKKADNEAQLLELIEEAPPDSIYYHIHSYFLRHYSILGVYPNDFANWVAIQVRDKVLGEKLSSIIPWRDSNIEHIRSELVTMIDDHLSTVKTVPSLIHGGPFYFMKSKIIEIPTDITVSDLKEFRAALAIVDASAIYNHVFEARLRIRKGRSDFAIWIEDVLGNKELAERIEMIDSYMYSLEDLRKRILNMCDEFLN